MPTKPRWHRLRVPYPLELVADGVQIYTCDAKEGGFDWSFKAPEANLFDKERRQIGTHFAGPTWKIDDGSSVVGEVVAKANAEEPGAIQWLLLRAKSHDVSGALSAAAYIRRTETKDGAAPRTGCDASHVAQQVRMRYSAIYQFFSTAKRMWETLARTEVEGRSGKDLELARSARSWPDRQGEEAAVLTNPLGHLSPRADALIAARAVARCALGKWPRKLREGLPPGSGSPLPAWPLRERHRAARCRSSKTRQLPINRGFPARSPGR
jgi:Protein of unknown function (DUF3455)